MSSGKSLRIDLYHRLSTFIIALPPLRERTGDIPELVDYFFNSLSKKLGKHISGIHKDVYDLLGSYSFPGNIRELKNIMERALIICQSDQITPSHFISVNSAGKSFAQAPQTDTFDLTELEKQTILRALRKVNFNKAEAARLLNIEWNALYRRIQKHNIELPSGSGN
jgi:transcriptional regulator with PAS, ATPase and Fis domain